MEEYGNKELRKKRITEVQIFPVPFSLKETKEIITSATNTINKSSKEKTTSLDLRKYG